MIIHTVKEGDTVYGIAKQYNVSPTKILEDNNLTNPDRLVVGEKLVIIFPIKCYTVKTGDTLSSIASRFEVPLRTLYQNNPALGGEEALYTAHSRSTAMPIRTSTLERCAKRSRILHTSPFFPDAFFRMDVFYFPPTQRSSKKQENTALRRFSC